MWQKRQCEWRKHSKCRQFHLSAANQVNYVQIISSHVSGDNQVGAFGRKCKLRQVVLRFKPFPLLAAIEIPNLDSRLLKTSNGHGLCVSRNRTRYKRQIIEGYRAPLLVTAHVPERGGSVSDDDQILMTRSEADQANGAKMSGKPMCVIAVLGFQNAYRVQLRGDETCCVLGKTPIAQIGPLVGSWRERLRWKSS